jgi:hypothetical protein
MSRKEKVNILFFLPAVRERARAKVSHRSFTSDQITFEALSNTKAPSFRSLARSAWFDAKGSSVPFASVSDRLATARSIALLSLVNHHHHGTYALMVADSKGDADSREREHAARIIVAELGRPAAALPRLRLPIRKLGIFHPCNESPVVSLAAGVSGGFFFNRGKGKGKGKGKAVKVTVGARRAHARTLSSTERRSRPDDGSRSRCPPLSIGRVPCPRGAVSSPPRPPRRFRPVLPSDRPARCGSVWSCPFLFSPAGEWAMLARSPTRRARATRISA